MVDINLFIALGAGFLSFISPCCLPLYPAYLSYITGMSIGQLEEDRLFKNNRSKYWRNINAEEKERR